MMNTTLRITCYRAADCGGSYLAFATPDESEFYALVAAIKLLGYAHAQWTPEPVKAWWLSPQGLARLCGRYPDLAWLIGEYQRASGETSGPSGASDDTYTSGSSGKANGKQRAGGKSGQRRKASGSSGKASGVPADVATALAVLYITPDAPVAVVKAVFRQMAKSAHPDTGGDHERMKHLIAAYELATTWAEAHGASLAGAA